MARRHLLAVALLVVVALTGCVERSVGKGAVTAYLNAGTTERAVGCPFAVHEEATEGIVGLQDGFVDFTVGPEGRIYVLYSGRVDVIAPGFTDRIATWDLSGPAAWGDDLLAGRDRIYLARSHAGNSWIEARTLDGTVEINRSMPDTVWEWGRTGSGDLVASTALNGSRTLVLDADLERRARLDLSRPDRGDLTDLGACRDRLVAAWYDGPQESHGLVEMLHVDGTPTGVRFSLPETAQSLAVGQELIFVQGHDPETRRWSLTIHTLDGTRLVRLANDEGRGYGDFVVAHDLVYNWRNGALLARPLADYLTRPS